MTLPFLTPLSTDTLRDLGIPEPWGYGIADRVRFGEIDALGHVNNTAYLGWFETFRIHYFREYAINDYKGMPPRIVLRRTSCDYLQEMKLNEDYIITGRTSEMRNTSFTMDYAVWSGGSLRATAQAVIVTLDEAGKIPLPDGLRETFKSRDGAVQL